MSYSGDLMRVGLEGEAVAADFLRHWPGMVRLEDVRKQRAWQRKDVDFRLFFDALPPLNVEVKSDRHIVDSGNVLFEIARTHHAASRVAYLGWSVFSEAHWLLIWNEENQRLFVLKMADLRAAFQRYMADAGSEAAMSVIETDNLRTTINVLIPLVYVPHRVYARLGSEWRNVK